MTNRESEWVEDCTRVLALAEARDSRFEAERQRIIDEARLWWSASRRRDYTAPAPEDCPRAVALIRRVRLFGPGHVEPEEPKETP